MLSREQKEGLLTMMTWNNWERIGKLDVGQGFSTSILRTQVPGGWLVWIHSDAGGITFYPDPDYEWQP
jgi:hypothetical protein